MMRLVLEFYLVLIVPLSYGFGLWLIWQTQYQRDFSLALKITGVILSLIGLGTWFGSYWSLGSAFGVLPQRQALVRRGLYHWLDHPMYLGIFLTFFGLSLAAGSLPGLGYCLFFLLPLMVLRAKKEGKLLFKGPDKSPP